MADVGQAIDYVLSFEDSTLSGTITEDEGGRTRFGIAERYHPELANCLFFTSMGSIAALEVARGIYAKTYADPLCIEEITNQDIANKLLSLGVNIGVFRAGKMLQAALGIRQDGVVGVETLLALSSANVEQVLADLKSEAVTFYKNDVAEHPEMAEYLDGWIKRAEA